MLSTNSLHDLHRQRVAARCCSLPLPPLTARLALSSGLDMCSLLRRRTFSFSAYSTRSYGSTAVVHSPSVTAGSPTCLGPVLITRRKRAIPPGKESLSRLTRRASSAPRCVPPPQRRSPPCRRLEKPFHPSSLPPRCAVSNCWHPNYFGHETKRPSTGAWLARRSQVREPNGGHACLAPPPRRNSPKWTCAAGQLLSARHPGVASYRTAVGGGSRCRSPAPPIHPPSTSCCGAHSPPPPHHTDTPYRLPCANRNSREDLLFFRPSTIPSRRHNLTHPLTPRRLRELPPRTPRGPERACDPYSSIIFGAALNGLPFTLSRPRSVGRSPPRPALPSQHQTADRPGPGNVREHWRNTLHIPPPPPPPPRAVPLSSRPPPPPPRSRISPHPPHCPSDSFYRHLTSAAPRPLPSPYPLPDPPLPPPPPPEKRSRPSLPRPPAALTPRAARQHRRAGHHPQSRRALDQPPPGPAVDSHS